ncbi:conserved hypothetical protein [Paenibacillus curdlanolyticus YK9]|uniref:Uncharacterized protein n=1 Tax=Paenibacillus curdlanolyticus YK9 TaxID=717606 RepID=E0IFD1_9BACL|nr:hypothetical protein [Paenibacillus curdlanolyticus]EFM08907.1 conserved hypothetical protein [Paenibacillus curdlanolyticus YK9]
MKIFPSIIKEDILKSFRNPMGKSMINHAFNTCGVESYLSVASVLFPRIILVRDYIFIEEFYNDNIDSLEEQFKHDKRKIEMFVNSWSLTDFFLQSRDESLDNDEIFGEFCNLITYCWSNLIKELFPDKKVVVEIRQSIMGEMGEAITVYQVNN